MSYCRWSSSQWMCDVYVYEDCMGGWTTHVAKFKRSEPGPAFPAMGSMTQGEFFEAVSDWKRKEHDYHDRVKLLPIQLEHAGGSFNHSTPGECADFLEELKTIGYNVPDYAIKELREEQCESNL